MRFWLSTFLICTIPVFVDAQTTPDEELRTAEEALAAALIDKDLEGFERLLAPDFVIRGAPDVDRQTWIDNARKLCWGDAYTITDFSVAALSAEAALVRLVLTTNQDPMTCAPAVVRSLITDVWRLQDDRWRLTFRHAGPADSGVERQFSRSAPPPPRWERSAELSLVSTGGNTNTSTLGVSGAVIWRPSPWTTEASVSFVRSETAGVESARTFVADLRQSRSFSRRLDAFVRLAMLENEFAGIDRRVSADGGIGYRLLEGPRHSLRADAGLGYSHEARLSEPDLSAALLTVGGAYKWQFSRTTTVSDDPLLTASLDEAADWRFANKLAVTTSMTRLLSLRLSHELKFVNLPVEGFEATDTIIAAAVVVKF